MVTDREAALRKIAVGDIFHASASNGASLLCLTMAVTDQVIRARNVATQIIYDFDRRTGRATWYVFGTPYGCLIDSVVPLPPDIHEIMLSLDRRGREAEYRNAEDPNRPWKPGDNPLTADQRRGLLFVADFYRAHPLQPPEEAGARANQSG